MKNISLEQAIINEFGLTKIKSGYYRTNNGRAYIKENTNGDFIIYSCNGDRKGLANSFKTACMRANLV